MKFPRNQANIKIVIGIQRSLCHIHWLFLYDEKEESFVIGGVNFHKTSCCVETFAPKRDVHVQQIYEYNTQYMTCECRI